MKLKKFLTLTALVLTGVGWGIKPASAALVYTPGDVLVGFYATGGAGASSSYVINLGSINTYLNATGPVDLSYLGNIGADLSTIYGANWATREDLYWGLAAGTGTNTTNSVAFGSHARAEEGVVSDGWNPIGAGQTRSNIRTAIDSLGGTYVNSTPSANSPNYAGTQSSSVDAGFVDQVTGYGGNAFNSNSGWNSDEFLAGFGNGTDGAVLDLFRVGNNANNTYYVGTFGINGSGGLSYSVVPEPSTYALLTIVGVAFLILHRRRRAALKA